MPCLKAKGQKQSPCLHFLKLHEGSHIHFSMAAETKQHTFINLQQLRGIMSQFCRSEVQIGSTGSSATGLTRSKSR